MFWKSFDCNWITITWTWIIVILILIENFRLQLKLKQKQVIFPTPIGIPIALYYDDSKLLFSKSLLLKQSLKLQLK